MNLANGALIRLVHTESVERRRRSLEAGGARRDDGDVTAGISNVNAVKIVLACAGRRKKIRSVYDKDKKKENLRKSTHQDTPVCDTAPPDLSCCVKCQRSA
jgi:hypothetical protein